MPLSNGTTLSSYVIEAPLGAGGMGEVYRARDTRLGRSVAVKVLPEAFLSDPDRIARFEREAKMLAVLNHPHIAALHSMEQDGGRHFLVMELVEGETLAERLRRGALPAREALRIGGQIVEALEAAHEKGVVHRDLKPGNVKLTSDDEVKVLDFGLAKALESPSQTSNVSNSPTLSMMATQAGVILGTAAYMSPEQAKGFPADQRSDIFSFGVVLYEMLTGRLPFQGETAPDILASILVRDADLQSLPPGLHPRTIDLLKRCLEKQPKRRWQAAGDLRAEMETILAAPESAPIVVPATSRLPFWRRAWPAALAAIGASALTLAIALNLPGRQGPAPITRFVIPSVEGQRFSGLGQQMLSISPSGADIVYVANGTLFLRSMSTMEPRQIVGIDLARGVLSPVFSPDSDSVLFWSQEGYLRRVTLFGGAPINLCPAGPIYGVSWTADGITFGQPEGILRVAPEGGKPEQIVKTSGAEIAYGPQLLPGGKAVLFTLSDSIAQDRWDRAAIVVQSLPGGERRRLIEGGSDARYLSTGHLVYVVGGTVYAVKFDPGRLAMDGHPVPVLEGVQRSFAASTAATQFAVADNGSLAYLPGPPGTSSTMLDIAFTDRKGTIEPLHLPEGPYAYPRISPNGRLLAFQTEEAKHSAVWIYNLRAKGAQRQLTLTGMNRYPVWAPDSQRVAFQSDREGDQGIFVQGADGTGPAERLTKAEKNMAHVPESWSPDGAYLLYCVQDGSTFTLQLLDLRNRKSTPFGNVASTTLTEAAFSPDGRWVAYSRARVGTTDTVVNVQPFPPTGTTYQIFARTGDNPHDPLWSVDSKELLIVPRVGAFEAVPVETTPAISFGNPTPVPRSFPTAPPTTPRTFDMAPDGRIVSLIASGGVVPGLRMQSIHVVLNWVHEMSARVAGTSESSR